MKTKNDVRLAFKRDTGENADKLVKDLEIEDPDFTYLEDLADDLAYLIVDAKDQKRFDKLIAEAKNVANEMKRKHDDVTFGVELDNIKYIEWLEEWVLETDRACKNCIHSRMKPSKTHMICVYPWADSENETLCYPNGICNKFTHK